MSNIARFVIFLQHFRFPSKNFISSITTLIVSLKSWNGFNNRLWFIIDNVTFTKKITWIKRFLNIFYFFLYFCFLYQVQSQYQVSDFLIQDFCFSIKFLSPNKFSGIRYSIIYIFNLLSKLSFFWINSFNFFNQFIVHFYHHIFL